MLVLAMCLSLFVMVFSPAECIDYCKAFYPEAYCLSTCKQWKGHVLHELNSIHLCPSGKVCCSRLPEVVTQEPPSILDDDACGVRGRRTKRSVGGEATAACSWPWLVSITLQEPSLFAETFHVITAVLVTKKTVLVHRRTLYEYMNAINEDDLILEAQTGEYRLNMVGDERRHDTIKLSEAVSLGEFLIFHLPKAVAIDECTRPVCLANSSTMATRVSTDTDSCRLVGWGDMESGSGELTLAPVPLSVPAAVDDDRLCKRFINITPDVTYTSSTLCLDLPPGNIATKGDRGNHLVCRDRSNRWYLKGILTHGNHKTETHPAFIVPIAEDIPYLADAIHAA